MLGDVGILCSSNIQWSGVHLRRELVVQPDLYLAHRVWLIRESTPLSGGTQHKGGGDGGYDFPAPRDFFIFGVRLARGVDITFTFYIQHIRVVGGSSGCASRCSMFRNKIHTFNYVLLIYRSNECPTENGSTPRTIFFPFVHVDTLLLLSNYSSTSQNRCVFLTSSTK